MPNQQNITKRSGGLVKISLNQYLCQLSYSASWAANGHFQLQLQIPINEEGVFALRHKARLLPNMEFASGTRVARGLHEKYANLREVTSTTLLPNILEMNLQHCTRAPYMNIHRDVQI